MQIERHRERGREREAEREMPRERGRASDAERQRQRERCRDLVNKAVVALARLQLPPVRQRVEPSAWNERIFIGLID